MRETEICEGCGADYVSFDPIAGIFACESCGLVREETRFQNPEFNTDGERVGNYVAGRGTGTSTLRSFGRRGWGVSHGLAFQTNRKRKYSTSKLDDLASALRLPKDKSDDVRHLLKVVTEDQWGTGRWMDILVASCIYIVARQNHLPLSAVEIGEAVNCGVKELFRMYYQVLRVMDIQTPEIDPVVYLDRILSSFPSFMKLEKDVIRRLSKQGHLLLHCGAEWFLSIGRHPLAVVAAVVVIVARANQLHVELNEVSRDLHVDPKTARVRLKEFQESLVCVGQSLPWGNDITLRTVNRHLPFLLQYLESKTKMKSHKNASSSLNISMEAGKQVSPNLPRENVSVSHLDKALCTKYRKRIKCSLDSHPYMVVEDPSFAGACMQNGSPSTEEEGVSYPYSSVPTVNYDEQSKVQEASTVQREQPEWEPLPPSFLANKAARAERLLKIKAAKKRIVAVKQDMTNQIRTESVVASSESHQESLNQKQKSTVPAPLHINMHAALKGLGAEDLLIEYLLLRGANEDLIQDGHYNLLLSSSPIQPEEGTVLDEDLLQYFKSASEIEFLKSLSQGEPMCPWLMPDEG